MKASPCLRGNEMRVLVCGGRSFDDLPLLDRTLDEHAERPITTVIHGGATDTREEKTMSKFARQVTRLAKPRMSRVAKPRGIPRLGAAPTASRLGVPRAPAAPRPAGMPRGIPRRRRR